MNQHLQEVVDFLTSIDPHSTLPTDQVIAACSSRGFSVNLIIAGICKRYPITFPDAKRLVVSHPAWGEQRTTWQELHEELDEIIEQPTAGTMTMPTEQKIEK